MKKIGLPAWKKLQQDVEEELHTTVQLRGRPPYPIKLTIRGPHVSMAWHCVADAFEAAGVQIEENVPVPWVSDALPVSEEQKGALAARRGTTTQHGAPAGSGGQSPLPQMAIRTLASCPLGTTRTAPVSVTLGMLSP